MNKLFKLGLLGVMYFCLFITVIVSLIFFSNKIFGTKFNGNYCAKILILDPHQIEEKRELPMRINVEVEDNLLVRYHFIGALTKYDSILLKEYNFINRETSNSNKFDSDSVCGWYSKSQKSIISIKIRYKGYCDN